MSKVFGFARDFAYREKQGSRIRVCFDLQEVGDGKNYIWSELTYFIKQHPNLTVSEIKADIIQAIDDETDQKILEGYKWNDNNVRLTLENQFNFKAAHDIAVQTNGANLPITFKTGNDAEGNPVYHTFTTLEELQQFYMGAVAYIQKCLGDGWVKKDTIDWTKYAEPGEAVE